jgi:hypothetical protein
MYTLATGGAREKSFPMTKFDDRNHPHCWHKEDNQLTKSQCSEPNCALIADAATSLWHSSVQTEIDFFATYQPYACDYMEYTTAQLQECVTTRHITNIQSRGMSVSHYLHDFIAHRLEHVTMYNDTTTGSAAADNNTSSHGHDGHHHDHDDDDMGLTIVFDTLALLHEAIFPDGAVAEKFNVTIPSVSSAVVNNVVNNNSSTVKKEEHYWVTGFYLSSEREVVSEVK